MPSREQSSNGAAFLLVGVICAASIVLGSPTLDAQRRMSPPMSGFMSHRVYGGQPAPRSNRVRLTGHSAGLPFRAHRSRNRRLGCVGGASFAAQQLFDPFRGDGFDSEHGNVVNRDFAIKAAIDPATELQSAEAERLACGTIAAPGYFLVGGGGYVPGQEDQGSEQAAEPAAQPEIIVFGQPASGQSSAQPITSAQQPSPTPPDEGPFVLVLRDGTQIQAVAFTRSRGKVVYITTEGTRRALTLGDLDVSTTNRVNEERGTRLELPM